MSSEKDAAQLRHRMAMKGPHRLVLLVFLPAVQAWGADRGMLYVKTDPPRVVVTIGGVDRGKTPVLIRNLPPGEAEVKLRLHGVPARTERITIRPGRIVRLEVTMKLPPAVLTVVTNPFDAGVTVDTVDRGLSPLTVDNLAPGEHSVAVSLEGYERSVVKVRLKPGENRVLELKLEKMGAGEFLRDLRHLLLVQIAQRDHAPARVAHHPFRVVAADSQTNYSCPDFTAHGLPLGELIPTFPQPVRSLPVCLNTSTRRTRMSVLAGLHAPVP